MRRSSDGPTSEARVEPRGLSSAPRIAWSVATPALILDLPKVRENIEEMRRRMETVPAGAAAAREDPQEPGARADADRRRRDRSDHRDGLGGDGDDRGRDRRHLHREPGRRPSQGRPSSRGSGAIGRPIVAVDDAGNAERISEAAVAAGGEVGVLVEIDVGLHRAGVRGVEPRRRAGGAGRAASAVCRCEGRSATRATACSSPIARSGSARRRPPTRICSSSSTRWSARGLATEIVAAGGLGTWDITGANPRITEIHAGSYIFSDAFHRNLVPGFDPALTVLVDGSSRAMERWRCSTPAASRSGSTGCRPSWSASTGAVRFEHGEHFIHEEHIGVELDDGRARSRRHGSADARLLADHGQFLRLLSSSSTGDRVIDVWPVLGRYGTRNRRGPRREGPR